MNQMSLAWLGVAGLLVVAAFRRPAYAVGFYMLTFFAAPAFWWWGDLLETYRWNFYAGVLLFVVLLVKKAPEAMQRGGPWATNAAPLIFLMAINAIVVHLLFAANPAASLDWLVLRLKFILLYFMLQYAIRDEKDYRIVALSIAFGMGYIGYEATINDRGSFAGGRLEGIGAAGVQSSNQLASLLITGLPIAATALFTPTSKWIKALVILSCALAFNVVLFCNSRGGFLGILLGAAVFLLLAGGPARKKALKFAAVGALGGYLLLGDPEIMRRFMTTFVSQGERDASAESRIEFWTAASRMAADYPLGSGGNSFSDGQGWRYLPSSSGGTGTRAVHNGFITELLDWGVQGLGIALLYLGAVFGTIVRGRHLALRARDPNAVIIFACLGAALSGFLMTAVFGDYFDEEWGFWTSALTYAYLRVHVLAAAPEQVAGRNELHVPRMSPAAGGIAS